MTSKPNPTTPNSINILGIWFQDIVGYGGKSIYDTIEFHSDNTWISYKSPQKSGKYTFDQKHLILTSNNSVIEADSIAIITLNFFYAYWWIGTVQNLGSYSRL